MRTLLTIAFAILLPAPVCAQAVWTGPAGGGMMSVQEAEVLEPGHFAFGIVADNYDRNNPFGIDVFDIRIDSRVAIISGLEFYARYHISRAVCLPGMQPAPPPPSDIVILDESLFQSKPDWNLYWPMPYLNDHSASVGDMTPGEYTFGLKIRLRKQDNWKPTMSASIQISVPGDMSSDALAKGSSSGHADWPNHGIHTAATWSGRKLSASANLGATMTGVLERPNQYIHAYADEPEVLGNNLPEPVLFHYGLGIRYRATRNISGLAELSGWSGWMPGGPYVENVHGNAAADALLGIQIEMKAFTLTAGVRQHLNTPQNGTARSSGQFGGTLDLSMLSDTQQRQYLAEVGVDESLHRPDANLVIVGSKSQYIPDPPGSRRIPGTYMTNTSGNTGFVVALSLKF